MTGRLTCQTRQVRGSYVPVNIYPPRKNTFGTTRFSPGSIALLCLVELPLVPFSFVPGASVSELLHSESGNLILFVSGWTGKCPSPLSSPVAGAEKCWNGTPETVVNQLPPPGPPECQHRAWH